MRRNRCETVTLSLGLTESTGSGFLQFRYRGSQSRNGNAGPRAGHVVETRSMAETDCLGVTALFAADPDFQVGPRCSATGHRHFNELPDPLDIEYLERVVLQDARGVI